MKATKDGEELIKVGYRLPKDLINRLEQSAIEHRRSINDELITILEEYLDMTDRIDTAKSQMAFLNESFKELTKDMNEFRELVKLGSEVKLQRIMEKSAIKKK